MLSKFVEVVPAIEAQSWNRSNQRLLGVVDLSVWESLQPWTKVWLPNEHHTIPNAEEILFGGCHSILSCHEVHSDETIRVLHPRIDYSWVCLLRCIWVQMQLYGLNFRWRNYALIHREISQWFQVRFHLIPSLLDLRWQRFIPTDPKKPKFLQ